MIYVRVELWPCGQKDKARLIGEMEIGNVGGNTQWGNYEVKATDNRDTGFTNVVLRHDRSQSIWTLLWKALELRP
jgi:hypothetical protein